LCWFVPVNRGEEVPGEGEGEAGVPLLHPALQPQHHWEPTPTRIIKCFPPYTFFKLLTSSVADPGCLSRIQDPTFFHPESPIRIFPSRIRYKEFQYFNPKNGF
jgi:hypothetical protein